jgi:hypothetical protein
MARVGNPRYIGGLFSKYVERDVIPLHSRKPVCEGWERM